MSVTEGTRPIRRPPCWCSRPHRVGSLPLPLIPSAGGGVGEGGGEGANVLRGASIPPTSHQKP